MRFRAKIVHVAVAGLPLLGCDKEGGPAKTTAKADPTSKTETTKQDPKQEAKQDPVPDPEVPIVIEKPEDIPVALAGAPMPYDPPPPPPESDGKAPSTPTPAPAPPAAAAPASAAAAAAPTPSKPTAITLAHNHPPGEPCKPLTRAEVEQALADLKK